MKKIQPFPAFFRTQGFNMAFLVPSWVALTIDLKDDPSLVARRWFCNSRVNVVSRKHIPSSDASTTLPSYTDMHKYSKHITFDRYIWLPVLTHWGRVTHIYVSKLPTIGSDNGLSPGRRQAIIWTNAGNIVDWTLMNKLQWNFNRNCKTFVQENAFESVVCEMATMFSRPQCVNIVVIQ